MVKWHQVIFISITCLIHILIYSDYFMCSAGWIGNDPLTVVIGPSDPYVSIGGRVCLYLVMILVLTLSC
jgi:hypothetical protein